MSEHFAGSHSFGVAEIDAGKVVRYVGNKSPFSGKHKPGEIPLFIESLGAKALLCGGIGSRAKAILEELGIEVVAGLEGDGKTAIDDYVCGNAVGGKNRCRE
jgi:predicted Fe-Mo cluster-binding NifX family protein